MTSKFDYSDFKKSMMALLNAMHYHAKNMEQRRKGKVDLGDRTIISQVELEEISTALRKKIGVVPKGNKEMYIRSLNNIDRLLSKMRGIIDANGKVEDLDPKLFKQ